MHGGSPPPPRVYMKIATTELVVFDHVFDFAVSTLPVNFERRLIQHFQMFMRHDRP